MPATLILTAIYGDMILAAAALGSFGLAAATFAIRLVATQVITSLIAKRTNTPSGGGGVTQVGSRVQFPPATDNKIGVVYGTAFMKPIIVDAKISTDQQTMWYVLVWSEAMDSDSDGVFSFGDIYWGDKKLNFDGSDQSRVVSWTTSDGTTDTAVDNKIRVYHYRDGSDTPVNTASTAYAILSDSNIDSSYRWNSTKKMSKLVFSIIKLDYDRDTGITGLPEITCQITNSLTKPGSVIKNYLKNSRYGAGLTDTKIDLTALTALDTYSDETISYTPASGTGTATTNRYRINGPVDTTRNFLDNLVDLCESCDSWLQWNEVTNKWSVVVNRSYLDLDPDSSDIRQINSSNIVGGIDISPIDLNSVFNSVEVQFPNTKIRDQVGYYVIDITSFPNVVRNANEPDNRLTISLPYCNNIVQAQYIAARRLVQSREDLVINFTMDYSGIQIDAGDVIGIHHERYGWGSFNELVSQPYGKLFRVTQVQEGKDSNGNLYARIVASEYNDGVYDDDNIDLADFTPELNTGISDPTIITTPNAPTTSDVNTTGNVPNFTVNAVIPSTGTTLGLEFWYGTADSLTTGDYKIWSIESPVGASQFAKGSTVSIKVSGLEADTYYWRVRAIGARRKSDYSNSVSIAWDPTFISGVVGQDVIVNFYPPIVAVPREGPNLVPNYTDAILTAYGQAGGSQVNYVDALTDADPAFTSSTWRIATNAINNYNTASVVTLSNIAFTLSNITTTTDGGVQFPQINAMNSSTAYVTIPVRFKDAAGNVFNSPSSTAQVIFVDQGYQGPAGEDGINPGFIDLTVSSGGFSKDVYGFFTPSTITVQVIEQNILNPSAQWNITGATYATGSTEFPNDTVTITPESTASVVNVVVTVDLYTKRIVIPIVADGPKGDSGDFAGRGFIPLAYIPIDVDPTLASQGQLTYAWTTATTYDPILNDAGEFWYFYNVTDGLGNVSQASSSTFYSYNGTQWIPAAYQFSGNLIADGTITGNQVNANSIFTNKLAATESVLGFGQNAGPGYWLDGSTGNAYFGGDVSIGDNLTVGGLIQGSTLIAAVVDTNEIAPFAVSKVQISSYEGTKLLSGIYNIEANYPNGSPVWTTGTRLDVLSVSITPLVSSNVGGRMYLNASTVYYNDNSTDKNLLEIWRQGNVVSRRKFIHGQGVKERLGGADSPYQETFDTALGLSDPRDRNNFVWIRASDLIWGGSTGRTDDFSGEWLSNLYIWNTSLMYNILPDPFLFPSASQWPNWWAFGESGRYAHVEITSSTYFNWVNDSIAPTVDYGQLQSYSTSSLWNSIVGVGDWPPDIGYDPSNITASEVTTYNNSNEDGIYADEGREILFGDNKGRIYWSKEGRLPKVFVELGDDPLYNEGQINDFAIYDEDPINNTYKVIAVGDNGRVLTCTRSYRWWGTDTNFTSRSASFEFVAGEVEWTETTLGSLNLNGVSVYDQNDIVIVGDFGTIYYSNNTGTTYSKVVAPTYENLTDVQSFWGNPDAVDPYPTPPYHWVAVGEKGIILRSTNGTNWDDTLNLSPETTYGPQTYTPDVLSAWWSWSDFFVLEGGDDRIASVSLSTATTYSYQFQQIAESTSSWKRIWYLGSNIDPLDTSTPAFGNRLEAPQSSIGITISDADYKADFVNTLTYTYHLIAGNLQGVNVANTNSGGAYATNSLLTITEFKR